MPNNKFAIFCTAAEHNQEKYIARVLHWHDMLYPVFRADTDFWCFVDGTLKDAPERENLRFVSFSPALGRKDMNVFPGYKRSFGEALRMLDEYDNLMLIENDVKVFNFKRVLKYREMPGLYSSIDRKWHFIETGFMILNDRKARDMLKTYYLSEDGIYEPCLFETTLSKYPFQYVFQSRRAEGSQIDLSKENLDYICQCMDNYKGPSRRILFTDNHALGDTCENLIALSHFHEANPTVGINYKGTAESICDNIPWIDRDITQETADQVVPISMSLINNCNMNGIHVVRCIETDIRKATGLKVNPGNMVLPIQFSKEELEDKSFFKDNGIPEHYWIVNAGGKNDFTTKHYPHDYFQKIIDMTKSWVDWVQVGLSMHVHKPLDGVVNMLDKTGNLRDLLRLIYFSSGVLTPISSTLHLAAMPMPPGKFGPRPCVVLGGGRETSAFTQYPNHHWFSSVGCLDCCPLGCWKAKVLDPPEGDCCKHPVKVGEQLVGKCMELIHPEDVATKVLCLQI